MIARFTEFVYEGMVTNKQSNVYVVPKSEANIRQKDRQNLKRKTYAIFLKHVHCIKYE